ncbi:hypothetical protein LshimejAT787_1901030 [Lyophyllum shimeji]|uniref:Uncharacterized protein n=1 Tax=Lyophyllum shimeji TaxID=47721 RepID=A0A9P3UUR8_LYOSH|nr:hypothetical protein LshimejAT787_1901030 [Lyophyllum shimeji]
MAYRPYKCLQARGAGRNSGVHLIATDIVRLPALEHLALSHPIYIQWKRSFPAGNTLPVVQESSLEESLPSLRSLAVKSTFGFIPQALHMHPSLTSHISHLLTHLSLDFAVPSISILQHGSLDADFFAPLLTAPFISRLAPLHVRHRAPLNMSDGDLDAMARSMPKLASLRLQVVVPSKSLRGVPLSPPLRILASLTSLASFTAHCTRLREITRPVDAETLMLPRVGQMDAPAGAYPVAWTCRFRLWAMISLLSQRIWLSFSQTIIPGSLRNGRTVRAIWTRAGRVLMFRVMVDWEVIVDAGDALQRREECDRFELVPRARLLRCMTYDS